MRRLLLILCAAACGEEADPSIDITAPVEGAQVPVTGDVTLTIVGRDLADAGGVDLAIDGSIAQPAGDTFRASQCTGTCQFTVTFSPAALTPEIHTVTVSLEYDLVRLAEDSVRIRFVAP